MIDTNRTSRKVVSASTLYAPPYASRGPPPPTATVTTATIASPMSAVHVAATRRPGTTMSTTTTAVATSTAAISGRTATTSLVIPLASYRQNARWTAAPLLTSLSTPPTVGWITSS